MTRSTHTSTAKGLPHQAPGTFTQKGAFTAQETNIGGAHLILSDYMSFHRRVAAVSPTVRPEGIRPRPYLRHWASCRQFLALLHYASLPDSSEHTACSVSCLQQAQQESQSWGTRRVPPACKHVRVFTPCTQAEVVRTRQAEPTFDAQRLSRNRAAKQGASAWCSLGHRLNTHHMARRIEEMYTRTERKKNVLDPSVYPTMQSRPKHSAASLHSQLQQPWKEGYGYR